VLMKEELCKEAVEAYKDALRNDPTDDETRYNLAIAKECAAQQKQDQDKEEEKKDEDKENEDKNEDKKEDEKKDDPKDEGDQDKKDGEDEKDEDGKPKDEKDQGKGDKKDDKKQDGKPEPKPGQLSPQQIKNLLEAMNNQEQKVQEKINAEKQKGAKVKTEKDW
jgi:Ca-activated chloride channel family protein